MQIESVNNVKINLLMKKFNKHIVKLKQLGLSKDEIVSELYTAILMCGKNFNKDYNVSFYSYLHASINRNLIRLINNLSEIRDREKSIDEDFGYCPDEQVDLDFVYYLKGLPKDVVYNMSEYINGEINEQELNDSCLTHKVDAKKILDVIDSYC